jgi:HemK-related putative methylase
MDIKKQIKILTESEKKAVAKVREEIIERLRKTPESGVEVEYLGKKFFVTKGVFQPRPDSMHLVENFEIKPNEEVLDVCTGSGVIAIHAALKGAKKVVAVDINPDAIKVVKLNAKRFGVEDIIDARESDVFSGVGKDEFFDVITCNPPFTDEPAKDFVDATLRDEGLKVAHKFFADLDKHLKVNGRVYVSQANSGNVFDMLRLANEFGFSVKLIGKKEMWENNLEFYAFELAKL